MCLFLSLKPSGSNKYGTSPESILLTWSLENKVIPIYATNDCSHLNVAILSFIEPFDIMLLDSYNQEQNSSPSVLDGYDQESNASTCILG